MYSNRSEHRRSHPDATIFLHNYSSESRGSYETGVSPAR